MGKNSIIKKMEMDADVNQIVDQDIEMDGGYVSNKSINFQQKLFDLKEQFYKASMNTPVPLQQELLVMPILREDLYDVADALDSYIDNSKFVVPINNTINVYNINSKTITEAVTKYSKQKQKLIEEFMDELRVLIDSVAEIEPDIKKYYIDQVFRIHVFNMEPLPGSYDGQGI